MTFSYPRLIFFVLAATLTTACTRPATDDGGAVVSFTFPKATQPFAAQKLPAKPARKNGAGALDASSKWLLADPTSAAQINCYLIAVAGDHPDLNGNTCSTLEGTAVASPGMIVGGFAGGSSATLMVHSGKERTFHLIGFATDDVSLCTTSGASFPPAHFSAPFLLASTTRDLSPGSTTVELTIPASLSAAKKFENCAPRTLAPNAPAPIPGETPTPTPTPTATPNPTPTPSPTPGATLSFDDAPTYGFGGVTVGNTVTVSTTLRNLGVETASSLAPQSISAPFTYEGGTYPGTGGTCGSSLASGSFCTLRLVYTPPGAAAHTGSVTLAYSDSNGAGGKTLGLSGTGVAPVAPSVATAVSLATNTPAAVNLSWTNSATGTAPITYDIHRSVTSGTGFSMITSGLTSGPYNNTGVTPGTTYYYKVLANGPGGTTPTAEYSAVPMASFALTGAAPQDQSALVSWNASAGASTYTVRYGTASGSYPNVASTSATSPFTVSALTAGTPYYFMVQAVNATGTINANAESTATPIAVPTALAKTSRGDTQCALLSNGDVKCWGEGGPILGNGSLVSTGGAAGDLGDAAIPAKLGTGATIAQVSAHPNGQHLCALLNTGAVKCWGRNDYGQLGYGDTIPRGDKLSLMDDNLAAVDLGTGRSAIQISVGVDFSCALLDNASVKCWGRNTYGQLGIGSSVAKGDQPGEMGDSLPAVVYNSGATVTKVSAGADSVCILLNDGTVKCWGFNSQGQLGIESSTTKGTSAAHMTSLAAVIGVSSATDISVGTGFACALLTGGYVKCWGNNATGQLGQGSTTDLGISAGQLSGLPNIDLGSGITAVKISAGAGHACAITSTGGLKCWGSGAGGALGLGNTIIVGDGAGEMGNALALVSLGTGLTAVDVVAGVSQTCVKLNTGATKCWGLNSTGQLGLGHLNSLGDGAGEMGDSLPAMPLGTGRTTGKIALGAYTTCVSRDDGSMICYGDNTFGKLAIGAPVNTGDDPNEMGAFLPKIDLGTGVSAAEVAMGAEHACARTTSGQIKCWGRNTYGQLGYGDVNSRGVTTASLGNSLAYVNLGTGRTAKRIAAGGYHTCAILDNDSVKCWGKNAFGQLGYNNTVILGDGPGEMGDSLPTLNLGGMTTAKDLTLGGTFSCAILMDDSMKCWGYGAYGQLGQNSTVTLGDNGSEMNALTPINFSGLTVKSASAGEAHVCAILSDDTLRCWGQGTAGKLGSDATANIQLPVTAVNLGAGRTAKRVSAATNHSCVILDNDSIKCFGANSFAALGTGNTTSYGASASSMSTLPIVALPSTLGAKEITTTLNSSCAILTDDSVRCWGSNATGLAGIGNIMTSFATIGDAAGELGNSLAPAPLW